MSYILEALKKSQQERELGQVPTLATESYAEPEQPAKINPLVVSALLLALLAVIVALYAVFGHQFFAPQEPPAQVRMVPPTPQVIPAPLPPNPVVTAKSSLPSQPPAIPQPEPIVAVRKELPAKVPVERPAAVSDQQATEKELVVARLNQPALAPERTPVAEEKTEQPVPYPSTQHNSRQELLDDLRQQFLKMNAEAGAKGKQSKTEKPIETAPPKPVVAQDKTGQIAAETPRDTATPTTKTLPKSENELPYDVFKRLPTRKVSALAYSKDPQRRFVLLNSQKMKEGEGTKEGLVIEEIRQNGIIFSFEGHRFFTSL